MEKQTPIPSLISFLLLPIMYFMSVKLSIAYAMTPEGTVIIWLPNAFALATLLYYQGQRYWLFMLLVLAAEVAGDVPIFRWNDALMLGFANVAEVTLAYLLMCKLNMSPALHKLEDVIKFILAAPFISSLFGALVGAAVLQEIEKDPAVYLSVVQAWWFGDALGLIIGTPLILALLYRIKQNIQPFNRVDLIVASFSFGVLLMLLLAKNGLFFGVLITPTLLIPSMLYLAARTDLRYTAIAVAIFSFAVAMLISAGKNPFGDIPKTLTILHAQEFIATLSFACLGFAVLLARIRDNKRELEERVAIRTSELQLLNQKLEQLSTTDGLTGLANRRHFDEVLELEWARANRTQQPITLAILDIDWFKLYNDHYGHQAGDECLRRVSAALRANICRKGDLVARYGGEEFVFIAPGMDNQDALKISEIIREEIKALKIPHAMSVFDCVTVSIGVTSLSPQHSQNADFLIKVADEALYEAKNQGRNRTVLKNPAI
jgi:diguanylate cyclase (GGDEF)-like protein